MEVTQLREIFRAIREFVRKADMILLALCVTATVFGIVVISSATNYGGSARYVRTQTLALILGIAVYVVLTLIDVDIIAERRELLLIFSVLFIGMLKIWGVDRGGNKSWLDFPFLPFNIQPAEICKIFYILILAKVISVEENKISSPLTVFKIAGITLLLAGEIILVSDDLGVALCYIFIFIIMAYVGGVNFMWFLAGFGAIAVASPFLWSRMREDQRNRILVIFDETIDPNAQGVRYQMNRSIRALQNGGITGQGLYHGSMVQIGDDWFIFYHRHTNGTNYSRQGCFEKLSFAEDGSIIQATMTSCCSLAPLRGEGEYPTYIACNLFTEVEATYVPWSGWMDDRFPKITQTGGDGDKNLGYIANMRNTATAGFKYFDCQGIRRISIRTKGYAKGCMEVRTAWDGPVLGTIPLAFANVWHDTAADIVIPDGVNALYFTFNGFGHLQFAAFNLMK